jgi:multiple sugar transport system ATP-binding protein
MTWLRARERDIALVFQFFALYPHMTVWQNIAFPLQAQGQSQAVIEKRVDEIACLLQVEKLLDLRPRALSGGHRQRVALARALVRRPAAFLLDEPLGALDAELRHEMRAELKRVHLAENATTVYVTHDQIEAMALGDRIVVMSQGVVKQIGSPSDIYHRPANLFVANFIGSPGMNLVTGRYGDGVVYLPGGNRYRVAARWRSVLDRGLSGDKLILGFRPEAASICSTGQLRAKVYDRGFHGACTMLYLSLEDDDEIVGIRADRRIACRLGTRLCLDLNSEMVCFFDPGDGSALGLGDGNG